MEYRLFKDGEPVNTIVASHAFVDAYANDMGYTYEPVPEPTPAPDIAGQIAELKAQLSATDYKVIKCSEAQMAGEELPYDIAALHAERQALRDQINALETQL